MHGQQIALKGLLTLMFGIDFLLLKILINLVQLPLEFLNQLLPAHIPRQLTLAKQRHVLKRFVVAVLPVRQPVIFFRFYGL